MNMENSALAAEKIDVPMCHQNIEDQGIGKQTGTEEDDKQQDLSKQGEIMDTKPEIENLDNQQPGCSDQNFLDNGPGQPQNQATESSHKSTKNEGESQQVDTKKQRKESYEVKMFSILAGNTNKCDSEFTAILENSTANLRKCHTEDECDIILVFCPIVSRAGTDIEAALKKISCSTETKLVVLVVLHHTFDPEKTILDSSRCVTRKNFFTVDLLFYEDTGLLKCQKNSDAIDKVVNWLMQQEIKGSQIYPRQGIMGKVYNTLYEFIKMKRSSSANLDGQKDQEVADLIPQVSGSDRSDPSRTGK